MLTFSDGYVYGVSTHEKSTHEKSGPSQARIPIRGLLSSLHISMLCFDWLEYQYIPIYYPGAIYVWGGVNACCIVYYSFIYVFV